MKYRSPQVDLLFPWLAPFLVTQADKGQHSYRESAYQCLPNRMILVVQAEPVTGEKVSVPMSSSRVIGTQAQANNIDPLIVDILTRHESGFNPAAVSLVGARGLMQLMPTGPPRWA